MADALSPPKIIDSKENSPLQNEFLNQEIEIHPDKKTSLIF